MPNNRPETEDQAPNGETAEDRVADLLAPYLIGVPRADEIIRRVIEASRRPVFDRLMVLLDAPVAGGTLDLAAMLRAAGYNVVPDDAEIRAREIVSRFCPTTPGSYPATTPMPPDWEALAREVGQAIREARTAQLAAQPQPEWIEWHGGPRPVPPDTIVDVRLRSGRIWTGALFAAAMWRWAHRGWPDDVMAYRVWPGEQP